MIYDAEINEAIAFFGKVSVLLLRLKRMLSENIVKPSEEFERYFDSKYTSPIEKASQNTNSDGYFVSHTEIDKMLIDIKGISISKKQRKDGRFQGYVRENGKKLYLYANSIDALMNKVKFYVNTRPADEQPYVANKKQPAMPTVSEWLDKWVELYKKPNVKPNTLESIKYAIKPVIKKFGNIKLNALLCDDIQEFLIGYKAKRQREVIYSVLKQSLERARKQGLIKINVCDGVELKNYTYAKCSALTKDEQNKLLEMLKGSKFEEIFVFLLNTGLRVGEALALTSDDIDYVAQTVSVTKNVVFINGERIVQDTPKTTAGVRTIPVPDKAFKFIKDKKGDLFPFTYNSVRLTFARIREKTGINVTAHVLRHTYATRLEEAGISPKVCQYLLGHSNIKITKNTYTDVQKTYIDSLSDRIKDIFD